MKLEELGEEQLLAKLLPRLPRNADVVVGAGDDCAVVRSPRGGQLLLLKTDCVVEGVHFTATAIASAVGWKAMARPLSDFAAMAGQPRFALVTLITSAATSERWVTELYRGMAKVARIFGVAIAGGETSRIEGPTAISVSLIGAVEKDRWVSRRGGKPGDLLFVTGLLGGSIRGKHLTFTPRIREARWLTDHFDIGAMLDLSDGLGADLPRLARASGVGWEVDPKAIPRRRGCSVPEAIRDGEDYELLFALAPAEHEKLARRWARRFPDLRLTCIGRLLRRGQVGKMPPGYDHFQ